MREADFIQPDISHAGGIMELKKIAAVAEVYYIPFAPHNPSGPVANAATLQLAACCPNFSILEMMNKAVFVTGGTVGSGLACAERFAKEGYDVFITSRNGERAKAAADGVAEKYGVFGKGYALDIRDEQRVIDIFNDIDSLDRFVETVVLNSADMGFGTDPAKGMDFFTVPVEEFQRVFETNLVWNFMIVRQAALRMREHHKGAEIIVDGGMSAQLYPQLLNDLNRKAVKGEL